MHIRKNEKGLTLVELIVAIAILAIVVLPLMTAFMVSLKTNARAKEKLRAIEIAHNMIEGMEAGSLEEVMKQLSYPNNANVSFSLLTDTDGITSKELFQKDGTYKEDNTKVCVASDLKFTPHNGNYYFYMKNIPADNQRKRFAAMVTVAPSTKEANSGVKYNGIPVSVMEGMDEETTASNSRTTSTPKDELLRAIRRQEGDDVDEDVFDHLSRKITLTILPAQGSETKTRVKVRFDYSCRNYRGSSFVFPDPVKSPDLVYEDTIYEQSGKKLKDVYLFYTPWDGASINPLGKTDEIEIVNSGLYDCKVKIIKQKWAPESVLLTKENSYRVKVSVNEFGNTGLAHTIIETNLGMNIANSELDKDEADLVIPSGRLWQINQASYYMNGNPVGNTRIYNAAKKDAGKMPATTRLRVSTGFGIQEIKDRLYDVTVDIYKTPSASNPSYSNDEALLAAVYAGTAEKVVSLKGGLTD